MAQTISIGNAVRFGWQTVLGRFWYFAGLQLILGVAATLPRIIDIPVQFVIQNVPQIHNNDGLVLTFFLFSFVLSLAGGLLSGYLDFGAKRIFLKSVTAVPAGYGDLKTTFKNYAWYFLAGSLFSIMVALGYVFLIIPGVIILLMFQFFPYPMLERGAGPLVALQYSMDITHGVKWQLFVFGLALFGINLLGLLALGLGLFVTIPLSALAVAHVYTQLRDQHQLRAQMAPSTPQPA